MKIITKLIFEFLRLMFRGKHDIVLENLALRQQLVVQQRSIIRSKIKNTDRIFWIWLSRIWNDWRSSLIIVKAPTVIGWHKKGFKSYWKRKSRRVGRPTIDWELIKLIRMLQKENVTWSAQRIQGELKKLGYDVCDNTVAKYMTKVKDGDNSKQQQWLTFLKNHAKYIVGIDFVVVRTVFFKAIYVFVAISHDRRKILHFAVTANPHSQWAIQQLRETFAFDETTKYVIRDNDKIFSEDFKLHIRNFGLEDTPTAPRSPWQNPICERVIGTLRRECLDHMIILNEKHLHSVLDEYINNYYNVSRTHMSIEKDSPVHRPVQANGKIVSKPILGGLHHVYSRVAWAENVFFVPPTARWSYLHSRAKLPSIGKYVDDAMVAIEKENQTLKGILPKVFARPNLDKTSLGGLIDLVGNIALGDEAAKAKDILGRVYEYFLGEFANAEGKKGGQFYTPKSIVGLMVGMIEPYKGRVFDPCCGSGGMFIMSEKFIESHQGRMNDIAIYGQESNQTTYRLCRMNLAIRQIDGSQVKWNNEGIS